MPINTIAITNYTIALVCFINLLVFCSCFLFLSQMEESKSHQKTSRPRLWKPESHLPQYELDPASHDEITNELIRKVETTNEGKPHVPHPEKDAYMKKHYAVESVDVLDKKYARECFDSFRCSKLREQSILLMNYMKKELNTIQELKKEYSQEREPRNSACIRELLKIKREKLIYINNIREMISEMIGLGEEAANFFATCASILSNSSKL